MGTTLTGLTPATTYDALIKVTDNGPLGGSLKTLTDGLGNDSALALSTGAASVTGTLSVSSNLTLSGYGSGTKTGTAAYNLAVDSSGNVIETAGGVVDGSGTANYVSKWSDPNTLTNSLIFDNGTNVGIGTTNPSYKLDVSGSARVNSTSNLAMFVKTNSAFGAAISYEDSTTGGNDVISAGAIGSDFYISTNFSERMRITASGNVGIGTTSPNAKLEVSGTLKATGEVTLSNYSNGGLSVDSTGVVKVEPSYQNISLGESYASNLREYYFRNGYTVSPTDTGYQYAKLIQQGLLNQASLVLVPQAQKDGLLAVNKPTGLDLTFTRSNDTATRVGPDGLIEKVRTNLVLQSNSFDTTWTLTTASVTSGQAGYDGTNDAWLLTKSAGNGRVEQSISASGSLTFSVYAKANANDWILLRADTTGGVRTSYFNISSGSVGVSSLCTPAIESAGNGYYRCSISFNDSATVFRIYVGDTNGSSLGATGNILIQASQLETGDIATDYIETTSAAVSVGPVANVPRLDYLNSSCPRLLLEPQRTNIITYSEQMDNAAWTKTAATITANDAVSPDGYTNADKLVEDTSTGEHLLQRSISVAAGAYTWGVFAKAAGRKYVVLRNNANGGSYRNACFDVELGTIVFDGLGNAQIQSFGNGWFRITANSNETSVVARNYQIHLSDAAVLTNSAISYTGDGTSGALVWGAQLESGAYATSYIGPTLGAAVTRGADDAIKTGISSLIGQTEGVLFAEFNVGTLSSDVRIVATMSSGSSSNFVSAIIDGTDFIARIRANTGALISVTKSSLAAGTHKMAIAYSASDLTFYLDGVLVGQNTSASVAFSAALSELTVGKNIGAAALQLSGGVAQALIFKTRLTNAQLAELTTI